jgi:glycosyltransferase involved in cell wall biosynthesis
MVHVIIPVFNKEAELERNVRAVHEFLDRRLEEDHEIILCDDGSRDASPDIAARLAASLPRIRALGYARNMGRGYAVIFAGRTCRGEKILFIDLDFPETTAAEKLLDMVSLLESYPVVIGSRFHPLSNTRRFRLRAFVGGSYRRLVRMFFPGLGVSDPDKGFKGFQRPAFEAVNRVGRMNRWPWDLEVLVIAQARGLAVTEIPVDWIETHGRHATSVKILRDSLEELAGILKIRWNLFRGAYRT